MSGGLPPSTAVERTVTMLSPPEVYLTVTSGFFSLKPSITAWKDFCSGPVQTPITEIEPETLSAVVSRRRSFPRTPIRRRRFRTPRRGAGGRASFRGGSSVGASCVSFRSVVDAESRLRVEEVQCACVDGDLDRLALAGLRPCAEAADHRRAVVVSRRARAPFPRCRRPFCSSRTSSVTAGRASMLKCTITSEPRASVSCTSPSSMRSGERVGGELGVLEVFRPDAEDDLLAAEVLQRRPG